MLMAHHYIIAARVCSAMQPQCVHTETKYIYVCRRRRRFLVIFLLSYSLSFSPFRVLRHQQNKTKRPSFIQ